LNPKFHVWLAAGMIGLALVALPHAASAHPDGTYPRIYNLDWTNNPDALRDSKYDVVSLSPRAQSAKWDSIKALNPACQRLTTPGFYTYYYVGPSGYASSAGPYAADDPVYGNDRKFWDLLNDNGWWAMCVDSTGAEFHATPYWQMWLGNFSTHCPKNAQGQRLCDVYGDFVVDNLVLPHNTEGVFFDQLWDGPSWLNGLMGGCQPGTGCAVQTPGTAVKAWVDLDLDGVADNPDTADAGWKAGVSMVLQRVRDRMGPNFIIVGNGQNHYAMASGAMEERFPRLFGPVDPAPNPYNYRWQWAMFGPNGYLSMWQTFFSSPTCNLIDTELGGGDRYHYPTNLANQQLFRFNLGSTLLGDGLMGLNSGSYSCYYWQPEYDLKLGFPRGPASSVVLSGLTVWKRDFTNGVVWVNPTGNALPAGANNPAVGGWDASISQLQDTIDVPPVVASAIAFAPPRPNPFPTSTSTTLSFTLDAGAAASLDILDMRGRIVRHVWTGACTGAAQSAVWDGRTDQGWITPVGVYFARIEGAAGRVSLQKVVRTP